MHDISHVFDDYDFYLF